MKNIPKNQSHKYYFDHPELWEQLRQHSLEKEIVFLDNFLKKAPSKKILDVGCGTGLHCFMLNKLGYETIGIDLNPNMVAYAKNKYPMNKFLKGDMKKLKNIIPTNKFDGLLCLCTTFTYNLTNKDIDKVLNSFASLLDKNGILIIEIFNPISFLEKIQFQGSFFQENKEAYENLGYKVDVKHIVDEQNQLIDEEKTFHDLKTNKLLSKDKTKFRLFFPKELTYFLENNGFKVIGLYGRYDLDYKKLDRSRMIFIAKKL